MDLLTECAKLLSSATRMVWLSAPFALHRHIEGALVQPVGRSCLNRTLTSAWAAVQVAELPQTTSFRKAIDVGKFTGQAPNYNACPGSSYLVYIVDGQSASLDLSGITGQFSIVWFNPRTGGAVEKGTGLNIPGGGTVSLGLPPKDSGEDRLAVVRAVK